MKSVLKKVQSDPDIEIWAMCYNHADYYIIADLYDAFHVDQFTSIKDILSSEFNK